MPLRPILLLPVVAAALAGCGPGADEPPATAPTPTSPATGSRFDAPSAGSIRGQVCWRGDVPEVPAMNAPLPDGAGGFRMAEEANPFVPVVDAKSRGVADAVVYLEGVVPEAGRPWDHPPVRVVMTDHRIVVSRHPGHEGSVGFVRRGDEVEMVSTDKAHHMLRARGAEFFTLPFPDPGKPLRRKFDTPGLVELTSGAGYYWAAADLFVSDHPYYAVTDREGRFTLPQVPPGRYELVCRVRSWHVVGRDRDPETGLVSRHRYAAPVEKRVSVDIGPRESEEQTFRFESRDFLATAGH